MEINASTFMNLFIKLCPFILVCFFTISSIFNNDLKGIVYLIGMLFTIGLTILVGNIPYVVELLGNPNGGELCETISFGHSSLSRLPLGEVIIGFTFLYLLTSMMNVSTALVSANWPTVIFFILLIIAELNTNSNIFRKGEDSNPENGACYSATTSVITYSIGALFGAGWAYIVYISDSPEFQYFKEYKHNQKCSKVTNQQVKCAVYKDGVKISNLEEPTPT
jgi:hypothetical protein